MKEQQTCYGQSDPTREREAPGNKHRGRWGAGRGAARSALVWEGRMLLHPSRTAAQVREEVGEKYSASCPVLGHPSRELGCGSPHPSDPCTQSSSEKGKGTSDIYMAHRDKQVGLEMASMRAPAALDHSQ